MYVFLKPRMCRNVPFLQAPFPKLYVTDPGAVATTTTT